MSVSIRNILIVVILLWIAYEYTNHMWVSVWQIDSKTIKCGIGIVIIVLLVYTPSIENIVTNTDIQSFLRHILVNETDTTFYTTNHNIHPEILSRMKSGAQIVSPQAEGIESPT